MIVHVTVLNIVLIVVVVVAMHCYAFSLLSLNPSTVDGCPPRATTIARSLTAEYDVDLLYCKVFLDK